MKRLQHPGALAAPRAQGRGFILIAVLALLLMLTMLSVSMFRSLGLEERITGNSREKQRAFFAAQSALQGAEAWLSQANAGTGVACSMTSVSTTPEVCTQASTPSQETLATTAWNCSFGTSYVPPAIQVNGNPVQQMVQDVDCAGNTASGSVYMYPQFAITYLGPDPSTTGSYLYQVTTLGYGGNENAVAVLQSVYSVGSGLKNFGMGG